MPVECWIRELKSVLVYAAGKGKYIVVDVGTSRYDGRINLWWLCLSFIHIFNLIFLQWIHGPPDLI